MANRKRRSLCLPTELDVAIKRAAAAEGTTVSAWLAETAARRLRLDAGRRGIAAWERENGPLTAGELVDGLTRARALLRVRPGPRSTRRQSSTSADQEP